MQQKQIIQNKAPKWCSSTVEETDKDNFRQAIVNNIVR